MNDESSLMITFSTVVTLHSAICLTNEAYGHITIWIQTFWPNIIPYQELRPHSTTLWQISVETTVRLKMLETSNRALVVGVWKIQTMHCLLFLLPVHERF